MSLLAALSFGCSLLITPILMMLISITFLASIGKSFGVRRIYIKLLLKIFEYGRQNIENVKRITRNESNNGIPVDDDEDDDVDGTVERGADNANLLNNDGIINLDNNKNITENNKLTNCNGHTKSNSNGGNSVISRDRLILLPDTENEKIKHVNFSENNNLETKHTIDFQLGNCLDYIKAGVEAIIEDEVTSRFEAEELKNWNLLTRTNRYYEFISWRLSFIWVCGFFVRYVILMPFRVFICFVGVIWLTICTAVVGSITEGELKRSIIHKVQIQCFGVLSSALSAVINYHNVQNRPGTTGICVANHTSPIDALVLMCDNCYSLVN